MAASRYFAPLRALRSAVRRFQDHRARWDVAAAALFTALALLLYLTAPLRYAPGADGHYSWIYARSLAYDGDLDFANDYALCGDPFELGWTTPTHHRANLFYIGPAVFWTPAIWVLKHFVHGDADVAGGCVGTIPKNVLAIACFVGGAAVLLTSALLRRWLEPRVAALATLLVALGSPLLSLSSTGGSYSHVYDAFCVAAYLYVLVRARERGGGSTRLLVLAGVFLGLAILQRSSNAVFGLVAPFALATGQPQPGATVLERVRPVAIVALFAVLFGIVPLLAANQIIYGRPILYAHGPHFLFPGHAHPLLLLFDERGGVFPLAPVLWLAVPGLVMLLRGRDTHALVLPLLACGAFELWLSASAMDWQGSRRLTNLLPLGALCLGLVVAWSARLLRARPGRGALLAGGAAALVLAWVNGAVTFAFSRGKLPFDRPLTVSERYAEGQTQTLAILEKSVGPLPELPAAWVFALRYHLEPIAFGWAAHPAWYQRDLHTLDYDRADFPFTASETRGLLDGMKLADDKPGACLDGSRAAAVFSLQWPFTTRVRLVYDATEATTLSVRSRSFFGAATPWETNLPLRAGKGQKVWLRVPPGALDSGINQVELERAGKGDLCLFTFEFVDDTLYPPAPEALSTPPVHMWRALQVHPDGAAAPSVAVGHDPAGAWMVEAHEAAGNRVESYAGAPGDFRAPVLLELRGYHPRIAGDPAGGWVVEAVQAQRDLGSLESRTGRVTVHNGSVSVAWGARTPYGAGTTPAIAAGGGQAIEVDVRDAAGALAVRTGVYDQGKITLEGRRAARHRGVPAGHCRDRDRRGIDGRGGAPGGVEVGTAMADVRPARRERRGHLARGAQVRHRGVPVRGDLRAHDRGGAPGAGRHGRAVDADGELRRRGERDVALEQAVRRWGAPRDRARWHVGQGSGSPRGSSGAGTAVGARSRRVLGTSDLRRQDARSHAGRRTGVARPPRWNARIGREDRGALGSFSLPIGSSAEALRNRGDPPR